MLLIPSTTVHCAISIALHLQKSLSQHRNESLPLLINLGGLYKWAVFEKLQTMEPHPGQDRNCNSGLTVVRAGHCKERAKSTGHLQESSSPVFV